MQQFWLALPGPKMHHPTRLRSRTLLGVATPKSALRVNGAAGAIRAPNAWIPLPRLAFVLRAFLDGVQIALATDLVHPKAPAGEGAPNLALMRTPKQRHQYDQQHVSKSLGAASFDIHPKTTTPLTLPEYRIRAFLL